MSLQSHLVCRAADIPVVTASERSNGIAGYYDVPRDKIKEHCITISANGSDGAGKAFWHPYPFSATADALICEWKEGWGLTPSFCLYVCKAISQNAWRFDYFRKSTAGRVITDVRIRLPIDGNSVDYAYVNREMRRVPGFAQLLEMLHGQT